ncbi:MAG: sulfide/dihydroorotate dehydrogenase-like FAD/NAD-binding protein [Anaerolineae bacterium]|nr:sulfide/dihydroorotate dehydrogenase-like FAD/NAD-binding protein [Anaerolineae bacterium]
MYEIVGKEQLAPVTTLLRVSAPEVARKAQAGQFVILIAIESGERIPLTLGDWDREKGTVDLVFQQVGKTTALLATFEPGDSLYALTGPLGRPSEIQHYGTVACVGGGVGIAAVYPIARALRSAGNKVHTIMGCRSKDLIFWEEKMAALSDEPLVCTDDGSYKRKALVTEPLAELLERERVARVWAVGPAIMMKFSALTCKRYETPVIVSLNSIMVDGTGMCGACRVEIGGETRFACVDGPEFDGHLVNWDLLLEKQRLYLDSERLALERFREQQCACGSRKEGAHEAA